MSSPIKVHVWGDFACFTRPEMKVERVSYDVITPSAARGILEAIYWKPQIRYVIEKLHILKSVQWTNIRRNEVASKIPAGKVKSAMKQGASKPGDPLGITIEDNRQQRAATILRKVGYIIEARFELLDDADPVEKHYNMLKRRAEKGQYFHHPYLGCREFPADFAWIEGEIPVPDYPVNQQTRDLGYMLHDIDYQPTEEKDYDTLDGRTGQKLTANPRFFRAQMNTGVITVPPLTNAEVRA